MRRFALGEAKLNNARSSLVRGRLRCILSFVFPLWAPFLFVVVVCKEMHSVQPTCSYICKCIWMWEKKNRLWLTGGPGGPWGPLGPNKPRGPYLETERQKWVSLGAKSYLWGEVLNYWMCSAKSRRLASPLEAKPNFPNVLEDKLQCQCRRGAFSRFFFLLLLQRSPKLRLSNASLNIYGFLNNHHSPPPFPQSLLCNSLPCRVRTDAAHPSGQTEPRCRMKFESPWVSFFQPVGNFTLQAEGGYYWELPASLNSKYSPVRFIAACRLKQNTKSLFLPRKNTKIKQNTQKY